MIHSVETLNTGTHFQIQLEYIQKGEPDRHGVHRTMSNNTPAHQAPTNSQENTDLFERVRFVIDRIRPAVQSDGGDIELIEVTPEGIVKVRLHGACVGCPSSNMTLRLGIERNLKERIPEVSAVLAIDDP